MRLETCKIMIKKNLLRPSIFVLAGALMSVGLAGCDQKKEASVQASNAPALPLTNGPATTIVPAPSASALPSAPPVRVVHVTNQTDRYAYVDRAYEMSSAIGQAPPDYDFEYEGVHSWVWRGSNREVRLIEPVEGGYRYYYFQPGAASPYLVRDPDYSYGYSDGQLVAIYDSEGRLLPPDAFDQRADDAGRYLARATALYQASLQSERRSVNAANWAARRAEIDAERSRWEAQQSQQDAWRAYHAQHEAEEQAYWRGERDQRNRSARSFNDWQSRGYNGPPPPPVVYASHDDRNNQSVPGQGPNSTSAHTPDDHRDGGQSAQPPSGLSRQNDAAQQTQADAARHDKAVVDAGAQARQQQVQADALRAQQKAQADAAQLALTKADAAKQAQAKATTDAAAHTQQQQTQADALHAQQKAQTDAARLAQAKADAARQAQAKAAADAAAQAQQQRPDAVRAQQKAQTDAAQLALTKADAAKQAQAKAAADAAAQARQHQTQADALRAQQKAQADAAQQAQIKADAARQAQAKAAADAAAQAQQQRLQAGAVHQDQKTSHIAASPAKVPSQSLPGTVPPTKEQIAAKRTADKKAFDDAHSHDDATGKPPAQQ